MKNIIYQGKKIQSPDILDQKWRRETGDIFVIYVPKGGYKEYNVFGTRDKFQPDKPYSLPKSLTPVEHIMLYVSPNGFSSFIYYY